jgi:uncharacterized membrane protein
MILAESPTEPMCQNRPVAQASSSPLLPLDAGHLGRRVTARLPTCVWLPAGALFTLYTCIGLVRYDTGRAGGFDLGIFSQAAQRWQRGELPGSAIRHVDNLFADHFSPITALFGVAWWVWADPRSLLVAQALAVAGCFAVVGAAWASRLSGWWLALLVAGYGLAKGVVSAVVFDVHEVGLGAPAMALLCVGLLQGRRRLVLGAAAALLLVKEDLGATVVVAGAVWFLRTRDRRTSMWLVALGFAGLAIAFGTILLASGGPSLYVSSLLNGTAASPFAEPLADPGSRFAPLLLFALTAGILGLRSPIALLAAPTLLWRFVSSNTAYWQTYFHYDLLLVPIAAVALLDVLHRDLRLPAALQRGATRIRRFGIVHAGAFALVAFVAITGIAKAATLPVLSLDAYRLHPPLTDVQALARSVPDGERVVAQQNLTLPLIAAHDVQLLSPTPVPKARWVVLTATGSQLGADLRAKRQWLDRESTTPGVRVTRRGDTVLVELPTPQPVSLPAGPSQSS